MSSSYIESSAMRVRDLEDSEDYKEGGYHPVELGEIYNSRYLVMRKLGYGPYSTVWLCYDLTDKEFVALKVMKSDEFHTGAGEDEIKFLELSQSFSQCKGASKIISFKGYFHHKGPHGWHICILLEVLKMNLLQFFRLYEYEGLPLEVTQSIASQVLEGLDFLHRTCKIIHTDLKPQHIMVSFTSEEYNAFVRETTLDFKSKLSKPTKIQFLDTEGKPILTDEEQGILQTDQEEEEIAEDTFEKEQRLFFKVLHREKPKYDRHIKVKIIDLTNACSIHKHYSENIQTRQYRAPEVILGINYNHTADIWSFACILFEMLTGEYMFKPKENNFPKPIDHLRQIYEVVGKIPVNWAASGRKFKKYFHRNGQLRHVKKCPYKGIKKILRDKFRNKTQVQEFFNIMLKFKPQERADAKQCLSHEWLRKHPNEIEFISDNSFCSDDSVNRFADQEDNS